MLGGYNAVSFADSFLFRGRRKSIAAPFDTKVADMDFILSPLMKGDGKARVTKICKVHLNRTRVFDCDYVRHMFT